MNDVESRGSPGSAVEVPDSGSTPAFARASILLVDDQPARLLSYEAILCDLRVHCVRALSGEEALSRLLKQEFAAILLDVNMPGMDGFEVARHVRAHPRFQSTPIVFVTGVHVTELDQLKGYEVGAIDYIAVPVIPEILRSKVAILVELYQRRSELQMLNRELEDARLRLSDEHARALAEREEQLNAIFDHPTELTVVLEAQRDAAGKIQDWIYRNANTNALKLLGCTRDALIGRALSEVMPDRAVSRSARFTQVLATRELARFEERLAQQDFLVTVYAMGRDCVVSSAVDITERKRVEAALRESEERFRELANHIDQFAWTCDELGHATWYNDRWYEYTGTTFDDMRGTGWKRVHHPAHVERVVAHLQQCVASGMPWEDTFPLRAKDGTYRWFLSRAVPIQDSTGRVVRWFGTNTDVTQLRHLQETLKETDRRKDEFLAVLAHELRNPLAPIRNSAQVLSQLLAHNDTQRSLVDIVHRQCTQLTRLVDDLLDVARITQGRIELRRAVVSIASCVELAVETVEPLIRERNHRLMVTRCPEPLCVAADKVRIAQCIANLLTNAAKYMEPGGEIRIRSSAQGADAVVEVADDGVGISQELLARVFEPFVQNGRPLDRLQGGLGIGLSICRQLIELHGGSVVGSSEGAGRGATFTLRLPLAAALDAPAESSVESPSQRVLVVDDNRDAANSLAMLLTLEGYQTKTAYSADEALQEAAAFEPQIVLLDIGLPRLNGYEVAQRIRSNGSAARIVALSCYGEVDDRRRSSAAGFDAHLLKPVDMTALKETLARPAKIL